MKITNQWVKDGYLYAQYSNGSIAGEPITSEQEAEFVAEHRF